jgi:carbon monoxide dehydrogenase subunit G
MPAVLERHYDRSVRVMAPLPGLYGELDSVEGIARFIRQIDRIAPADEEHARCQGSLSIGPLSYRLNGELELERLDPPHGLRLRLHSPALRLEIEGLFEFVVSAENETTVHYAATIRSAHPLVRRMGSALTGLLEEHVDSATDLVAVRGRQYAEAQRRFTELEPSEEQP